VSFSLPYADAQMALAGAFSHCARRVVKGKISSKSSYSITLLNCLPGSCRTTPFISRSKSVARTSEEFKPEFSARFVNVSRFFNV
jgi:hypothetical protein